MSVFPRLSGNPAHAPRAALSAPIAWLILGTCLSLVTAAGAASAAENVPVTTEGAVTASDRSSEARQFVQNRHSELHRAVKAAKDPKSDPAVSAIFDSMLDYEALTRDSLGSQWQALNAQQQKEFGSLLEQLVQKSYRKNLRDPADYSVEYTGEVDAAKGTLVKTLAQKKNNKREKPLGIDYVVGTSGDTLKVRDVVTDGVSLVGNYRSQFKRIIKKKGVDGLLEQMRKQLDK